MFAASSSGYSPTAIVVPSICARFQQSKVPCALGISTAIRYYIKQMRAVVLLAVSIALCASQSMPAPFSFATGGREWGGLCATGDSQSPIDIPTVPTNPLQPVEVPSDSNDFSALTFSADQQPENQFSSGGFLLYPAAGTISATVNGVYFEGALAQFHFHMPGVHLFDGMRYPVEMHLVFNPTLNDTGITSLEVAIRFVEGPSNDFVDSVTNQQSLDLMAVMQGTGVIDDYYFYSGSNDVPVPDCLENVYWVVPSYILTMSPAQVQYYSSRYVDDLSFANGHGAYREVQPLNGRTIYRVTPGDDAVSFLG